MTMDSGAVQQLMELIGEIHRGRSMAMLAEARLEAAQQRCELILEAKNLWMDRALKAEAELKRCA